MTRKLREERMANNGGKRNFITISKNAQNKFCSDFVILIFLICRNNFLYPFWNCFISWVNRGNLSVINLAVWEKMEAVPLILSLPYFSVQIKHEICKNINFVIQQREYTIRKY